MAVPSDHCCQKTPASGMLFSPMSWATWKKRLTRQLMIPAGLLHDSSREISRASGCEKPVARHSLTGFENPFGEVPGHVQYSTDKSVRVRPTRRTGVLTFGLIRNNNGKTIEHYCDVAPHNILGRSHIHDSE